jgi:selenocysteine lyase/cysteine desulfurase
VFSSYKLFSSQGAFMYGKEELLNRLPNYRVAPAPESAPGRWEWGNRDQTYFASIKAVIDHLLWLNQRVNHGESNGRVASLQAAMEAVEEYGREQSKVLLEGAGSVDGLLSIPHVETYGMTDARRLDRRFPTFCFKVRGVPDAAVVAKLWEGFGVAIRTENFYSKASEVYDQKSFLRVSFVHYNTIDEIVHFLGAVKKIASGA